MAKKVFVFFNCDNEKSEASMNIFYNSVVYSNSAFARRRLLDKILEEQTAGRVKIADNNIKKIESLILDGDPAEASEFIQYGIIKDFELV